VDVHNEAPVEPARSSARPTRVLFLVACWVTILYGATQLAGLAYALLYGRLAEGLEPFYRSPAVHLTFAACVVACVLTVLRRPWAPHLVRTAASWLLSLQVTSIPIVLHSALRRAGVGWPLAPGETAISWIFVGFFAGFCFLFVLLMTTGGPVVADVHRSRGDVAPTRSSRIDGVADALAAAGTVAILTALLLRWRYAEPYGSHVLIVAALLMMAGQILSQRAFAARTALTMSAIILSCEPPRYPMLWALETWAIPVVLGTVALLRGRSNVWLRALAFGVPIALGMVTLGAERLTRSDLCWRLPPPLEPNPVRPADFPDCLQVPEGATVVCYESWKPPAGDERFLPLLRFTSVSFSIVEQYPAKDTLRFISDNLESAGWRKLSHLWYDPTSSSPDPNDWEQHYDEARDVFMRTWQGFWASPDGYLADAFLSYSYLPESTEPPGDLRVHLSMHEGAAMIDEYWRAHPEEAPPGLIEMLDPESSGRADPITAPQSPPAPTARSTASAPAPQSRPAWSEDQPGSD